MDMFMEGRNATTVRKKAEIRKKTPVGFLLFILSMRICKYIFPSMIKNNRQLTPRAALTDAADAEEQVFRRKNCHILS